MKEKTIEIGGDVLHLETKRYAMGGMAVLLVGGDGDPYAKVSTFLEETAPADGCFWLKDWSENEVIAKKLLDAGLIVLTGRTHGLDFCDAKEAKLVD